MSVSDARADAPVTMYRARLQATPFTFSSWYTTKAAACTQLYANGHVGVSPQYNDMMCFAENNYAYADIYSSTLCPPSGTAPDTTKPLDQQCTAPPPDCSSPELLNKYRGAGVTGPSLTETAPPLICVQGCGYTGGAVMVTVPKGSAYEYSGRLGAATGQACTTANYDVIDTVMYDQTKDDRPPSPLSCADQGKVYGTFNGVGMCVNGGVIPGSTVTTSETKTSTQTDASGVQAAPQTETTSYSVGNINGVAMVTSTVTHSDGSKSQVTQTQDGFCRENPSASPCGGGGGGGGGTKDKGMAAGGDDCNAPPVCSGDAIACMIVKQQYNTRCELQKSDGVVEFGQKLANGQDPDASTLPSPSRAEEVDLSSRLSNVDNMGIAAQCLPDLHIALPALPGASGGTTLTIDTGPLCDFGKLFGLLNLLGTTVLCAYMLRGAI